MNICLIDNLQFCFKSLLIFTKQDEFLFENADK